MELRPKKDSTVGKWGYVDNDNVFQILPLFESASPFEGEYASVSAYGVSFFINKKGKIFKEIPDDPDAPEDRIIVQESLHSLLDILMDGFSKATDILHKGLRDCE